MHFSQRITVSGKKPKDAESDTKRTPPPGLFICWTHYDPTGAYSDTASKNAAKAMFGTAATQTQPATGYGAPFMPAYPSNHQYRQAIDMTIVWDNVLAIAAPHQITFLKPVVIPDDIQFADATTLTAGSIISGTGTLPDGSNLPTGPNGKILANTPVPPFTIIPKGSTLFTATTVPTGTVLASIETTPRTGGRRQPVCHSSQASTQCAVNSEPWLLEKGNPLLHAVGQVYFDLIKLVGDPPQHSDPPHWSIDGK